MSTPSRPPWAMTARAPSQVSSEGWKMSRTVPGSRSFMPLRILAAPRSMATWVSWPQACMRPGFWDL